MSKCKAFVSNPANNNRVEMEKRDYGITSAGLLACNEFINTDVDFFAPYKPKPSKNPYAQYNPKPEPKQKGPIVIKWDSEP